MLSWSPDAVRYDQSANSVPAFHGPWSTRNPSVLAFFPARPASPANQPPRVCARYQEKMLLLRAFPGVARTSLSPLAPRLRNLPRTPCRCWPNAHRLGSTHPRPFAVAPEPVSTSALNLLRRILLLPPRSALRDAPRRSTATLPRVAHAALLATHTTTQPSSIGRPLRAIHFRRLPVRQVGRNTLLSGCRLSWPPPCCQNWKTAFALRDP